jgi:hypothetical protein
MSSDLRRSQSSIASMPPFGKSPGIFRSREQRGGARTPNFEQGFRKRPKRVMGDDSHNFVAAAPPVKSTSLKAVVLGMMLLRLLSCAPLCGYSQFPKRPCAHHMGMYR